MPFQIVQMVEEIKKCEKVGAWNACLLQIYAYIDALAFVGMPITAQTNTRQHYIDWVNKYLECHEEQIYKYRGHDVYGARCATLHSFSSESDYHEKYPEAMKYGYHTGGRHYFNASIKADLVMIGLSSFINDFIIAVGRFLADLTIRVRNEDERLLLDSRIKKIIGTFPFDNSDANKSQPYTFAYGIAP